MAPNFSEKPELDEPVEPTFGQHFLPSACKEGILQQANTLKAIASERTPEWTSIIIGSINNDGLHREHIYWSRGNSSDFFAILVQLYQLRITGAVGFTPLHRARQTGKLEVV